WDVAERARVANFSGHAGAVRAVAFSRDGKQVASAGEDHLVTVWDATTGRKTAVLAGHQTRVTAVAFARDADVLASVDHHGRMIVWNVARRRPQVTLTTPPDVPSYAIDLTPRGDVVATSAAVTSLRDRRHLLELKSSAAWPYGSVYATRSFDDGRSLAVVTDIGWLLIFDLTTRRVVAKSLVPHTPQVAVDVSRDGRFLVTGDDAGAVRLWSAHPLRELRLLGRHAARAKSVAFSPDGTLVASAGDDRMIALWNAPRGGLHRTVGTHAMPVYSVAFSPDGRRLVSGEHDASVRIYTRRRTVFGFAID
ncbi:MAG TPA: WD40 repeat domain-containing protein, partial [Thermoanaerobaculia bacterium]|nr:WD40 repeat domain-containing protein [Thermoanaerobaculia bacterium]